jgi:hypothetical protein
MSEDEARARVYKLTSKIFEDAKTYDVKLSEESADAVVKEVWPDLKSILQRRVDIIELGK